MFMKVGFVLTDMSEPDWGNFGCVPLTREPEWYASPPHCLGFLVSPHCLPLCLAYGAWFLTLTLTITCTCCYHEVKGTQDPKIYSRTCCYDEIKGTQDPKIYSHAHSLILCIACFWRLFSH